MKVIALVTLVTAAGEVTPGSEAEIKYKAEAESLIKRGFASLPVALAAKTAARQGGAQTGGSSGQAGVQNGGAGDSAGAAGQTGAGNEGDSSGSGT